MLFWNRFTAVDDYFAKWDHNFMVAGDPPCEFTHSRSRARQADAVIFHLPTLKVTDMDRAVKYPGQRWVAWSLEHELIVPLMTSSQFMSHFDLTIGFDRSADIWMPYVPRSLDELSAEPVSGDPGLAPAVAMVSNPKDFCGRASFLAELMEHLEVDSFGAVHPNGELPGGSGRNQPNWRASKRALIGRYRFTIAFENAIRPDYVTEKFFDPLAVGSVPVYMGAPNIDDFAPAPDCYVDAREFATPRDLANHVTQVVADDELYWKYHEWRSLGASEAFAAMVDSAAGDPMLRLVELLRSPAAPPGFSGRAVRPFRRPIGPRVGRRVRRIATSVVRRGMGDGHGGG